MENEREITFVNIPMGIFSNPNLTPAEKHLYGWLSIFKKQCCFMSNEAIANKTGLSERTVSRALQSLQESGYVIIEFVNGNNANRRIYTIFDNPQKIKYLAKKGLFNIGDSSQNGEVRQNGETHEDSSQNGVKSRQNGETTHPCSSRQNGEHIIIKDNKKIGELAGLAGNEPASQLKPKREDFPNTKSFLTALKKFNEEVGKNEECKSISLSRTQEISG